MKEAGKIFMGYGVTCLPGGASGKESTCHAVAGRNMGLTSGLGRFPWSRKWHSIPVFLPGKLHGQRSQVRYSSWGREELDITEGLSTHPIVIRQSRQPLKKPSTQPEVIDGHTLFQALCQ